MGAVNVPRLALWGAVVAVLILAPVDLRHSVQASSVVLHQSFAVSMLSQMGIAVIFALSYNMLLGQTGELSFGHAVYYGLGAYVVAHTLNGIAAHKLSLPVTLLPLVGGLAGLGFGIVFGYVTTRRSATAFAMISLGIGEMVAACALMFPAFFGGEGGIATNRQVGHPVLGISYGPQLQVYYLIAAWCFISMIAMFAFTQTPLGRMANAVRDNPERVRFVGYNPTRVRYIVFCLSSFFAGVAGSLGAVNYEIVTAENLGVVASGNVLLMTFIGGVGQFYGPVIGAVLVSFLQSALSSYTQAWQLYFGLFFVLMLMFAPGGISSLVALHAPALRARLLHRLVPSYLGAVAAALVLMMGVIALVEMTYHLKAADQLGKPLKVFGVALDTGSAGAWLGAAAVAFLGGVLLWLAVKPVRRAWAGLNAQLQEAGG
jgi:branched-chain amino acid transport system permease protein